MKYIYFFVLSSAAHILSAQVVDQVNIEECYQWAEQNYPLIRQLDLIDKTMAYNIDNAAKGQLPQININGQATYQSEVTNIPIELPNVEIPSIDKAQYKVYADIYKPLTNKAHIKTQKAHIEASSAIEKQHIQVSLYQLKVQINQVYFGTLLIENQLKQIDILLSDLRSAMDKTEAAVKNGTAIENNLQLIKAEQITARQKQEEAEANRSAFVNVLALLTGQAITVETTLMKPKSTAVLEGINRPELELYKLQGKLLSFQNEQIKNSRVPSVGLFLQTGLGRPALNFLSNDLSPYYIGGIKFNWNLSSRYRNKNDEQIILLNQEKIQNQEKTFLLNTNLTMAQQSAEISKYEILIRSDRELINIRQSIKENASIQLSNGLISALDYVSYINAENKARENLILHEIQLLMSQYNIKTTSGN